MRGGSLRSLRTGGAGPTRKCAPLPVHAPQRWPRGGLPGLENFFGGQVWGSAYSRRIFFLQQVFDDSESCRGLEGFWRERS